MKLQRYDYSDRHGSMVQDKNGPWVHFSDTESLQSQLAAANERADGLQRIVDEARAQKPVCITTLDDFGTVVAYPPPNVLHSVPLYAAAPVPAQPAVVPEVLRHVPVVAYRIHWGNGTVSATTDGAAYEHAKQQGLKIDWLVVDGGIDAILSTTDTEVKK